MRGCSYTELQWQALLSHSLSILAGAVDNAVIETIERLLRAPSQMGLYTRTQCLEYLGSLFRNTLDTPARLTDLQVRLCPD